MRLVSSAVSERAQPASIGSRQVRLGAVLAVAIAVGFLVWLLFIKGDDNSSNGGRAKPVAATPASLRQLAASSGHSIYWVGRRSGTYELTQTSDGSIYVRYLPPGVRLGDSRPNFLTIGTYPHKNALATVRKAARRRGASTQKVGGGGLAVSNQAQPRSTYLAYKNDPDLLLEVYDPSPAQSRRTASSGRIVPVR